MSLNALGFGATAVPAVPQLGGGAKVGETKTPADEAKIRAEASAARQRQELDEIREKGLYAWAQEKKFEALKAKIREDLLKQHGIDEASLAAMSPEEQDAVMSSLEQEMAKLIQEAMHDAVQGEAKAAAEEGRPPKPMIIDISV
jgi:hypothetical protein